MTFAVASFFVGLLAVQASNGYSVEDLKVAVHQAVESVEADAAAITVQSRSSPLFTSFMGKIIQDEADERVARFEVALTGYQETMQKITILLQEAAAPFRHPSHQAQRHVSMIARDILLMMPHIQELAATAQDSLRQASELARGFNFKNLATDIAVRGHDLSDRGIFGWVGGLVSSGPTYIMNNIASFATWLSPSSSSSIVFAQYVAGEVLEAVTSLGSTITQAAAQEVLFFLGPFADVLGDTYDQIEFSFQQTFPAIFT